MTRLSISGKYLDPLPGQEITEDFETGGYMSDSVKHPTRDEIFDCVDPTSDNPLPDMQKKQIEAHLALCQECQEYAEDCRLMAELGQQFQAGTLPPLSPKEQAEFDAMHQRILPELLRRFREMCVSD